VGADLHLLRILRRHGALLLAAALAVLVLSATVVAASGGAIPKNRKPQVASAEGAGSSPRGVARPPGPTRLGFCGGDDWEPEIAARGAYVYAVIAHFPGNTACDPASGNGRDIYIQVSADGGKTFGPPHAIPRLGYPSVVDCVVTVDDSGAVYVSFLAYGLDKPTDVLVAKSIDHGATFTSVKVNGPLCTNCDHPWTLAKGSNVYVTYASGPKHFLSRSADGGQTWTETNILVDDHVAFPEGGVLDAAGNAWFAWGDCSGNCTGRNAADYRVSRTQAGTSSTTFSASIATAPAGPDCPFPQSACGFAYWGPQNDVAIDGNGNLYMVWQDGQDHAAPKSPPIVQLSKCLAGKDCVAASNWTYVGRVDDKTAAGCSGSACYALYPRIEGGAGNRISVIWMDDRQGAPLDHVNGWNVWYRSSRDGGASWTGSSVRVSQYDPARPESRPNGYLYPYGDYQGIDLTATGKAVMVWGEGQDYLGGPTKPGHILYATLAA